MADGSRSAHFLVVACTALAALVVVLGAYTRLVDAGLGCPDWPGCYGHFGVPSTVDEIARAQTAYPGVPVDREKAWTEMVHRYAAATLGIAIVVVFALTLKQRLQWRLPATLVALVVAQGAFGAWTVTLKLWPPVVTTHLMGGFATLALLWLLTMSMRHGNWRLNPSLRGLAASALAVLLVQIALGGWLTSNYAALACPDFPTCHGEWVPTMDFAAGFDITQNVGPNYLGGIMSNDARVAIHIAHRVGAVAVVLTVGWLAVRLGNRPVGWTLAGLLAAQFGLGVANVAFVLPLPVAVLHNAGAAALLLAVVGICRGTWSSAPARVVERSRNARGA